MEQQIKEALEKLQKSVSDFQSENDKRLKEIEAKRNDPLLAEKVDKMNAAIDAHEKSAQQLSTQVAEAKRYAEELEKKLNRVTGPGGGLPQRNEKKESFFTYARRGVEKMAVEESKALVSSDDTAGGYLAPPEYIREIIKAVVLVSPMRGLVRVRGTGQRSVQMPKRNSVSSAKWIGEIDTRGESTNPAYGLVEIPTHELTAEHYVSFAELEDSVFDIEAELQQEFAEQFAVAEGKAIISGDGVQKPYGFLNDPAVLAGFTKSGSAAAISDANGQADGIIDLFHNIKTVYANAATWCLNRKTLGAVRKLKDAHNQYIWAAGVAGTTLNTSVAGGWAPTILGSPYCECPDMPDVGANAFPIAYGDWKRSYVLVDRIAMSVVRDPYTKAGVGQVRFVARRRVGGQVVLSEAIKILKCAA